MQKLFSLVAAVLFAGSMMADPVLIKFTEVQVATQVAGSTYGSEGFTLVIPSESDKAIVDANNCTFGVSAEETVSFTHRLKTGGASSKADRIFTLNIPEEGPLAIYARTSKSSATDRNFVIRNGSDTIANHICLDTDTVEDASSKIFLPFIVENVPAGSYEVSYPVEGINFYGFQMGLEESKITPVVNYWLVGTAAENGWDETQAMPMPGDSIVRHLTAGTHEFKVLVAEGSWDGALGYGNVDAECSSEGYENNGGNVKINLNEAGDVNIKIVNGQICVTGSFGSVVVTSYTIAGVESLMGSNWSTTDTNNDMTENEGVWTLVKNSVALTAGNYEYKLVGNHAWGVADFPASGNNTLAIAEDGTYNVTFTWTPAANTLTADAELAPAAEPELLCTLDFPSHNDKQIGDYTSTWTATVDGLSWTIANFNNNNNVWDLIKCGRKNVTSVASIETPAFKANVTSIIYNFSAVSKVDSAFLYTLKGATQIAKTPVTLKAGLDTFAIENGQSKYSYKLEIYCASASGNGPIQLSGVTVYGVPVQSAVEDPVFDVPAGSYYDPQTIHLSCATPDSVFFYTTDGTEPTRNSNLYYPQYGIYLSESATIKAIAFKNDLSDSSDVVTKDYQIAIAYASLAELINEAGEPAGQKVVVTLTNETIDSIYVTKAGKRNGIYLTAAGRMVEIYCYDVDTTWVPGGTVSGTVKGEWKKYIDTWEVCPSSWRGITYKAAGGTVTPPADATFETYNATSFIYLIHNDDEWEATIAIKDDKMYIKNVLPYFANAKWIEGTIDNGIVTFAAGQVIGDLDLSLVGRGGTNVYPDCKYYGFNASFVREDVTFSWNATTKTLMLTNYESGAADDNCSEEEAYIATDGWSDPDCVLTFVGTGVTPTGVEAVKDAKATKALVNGKVIVIRNGARYNVAGQIVK